MTKQDTWLLVYDEHELEPSPSAVVGGLRQIGPEAEMVVRRAFIFLTDLAEDDLGRHIQALFEPSTIFAFFPVDKIFGSGVIGDLSVIAKMFVPDLPDDLPI